MQKRLESFKNHVRKLCTFNTITTHGGKAHNDDDMACSLLWGAIHLAGLPLPNINRCAPTEEMLNSPLCCVVDVGGRHEPHLFNFDHHGILGLENACAITLILDFLGIEDEARRWWPWLGFYELADNLGFNRAAYKIGTTPQIAKMLSSPRDNPLLTDFGAEKAIFAYQDDWKVKTRIGSRWLSYAMNAEDRLEELVDSAEIGEVDGVQYLDLRTFEYDDPFLAVDYYIEHEAAHIGITVNMDGRPENPGGWTVARQNDFAGVDFSKCAGMPGVVYIRDFVAKVRPGTDLNAIILAATS